MSGLGLARSCFREQSAGEGDNRGGCRGYTRCNPLFLSCPAFFPAKIIEDAIYGGGNFSS